MRRIYGDLSPHKFLERNEGKKLEMEIFRENVEENLLTIYESLLTI